MKSDSIFIYGIAMLLFIIYIIDSHIIVNLYNTPLGNFCLLASCIYIGYLNIKWGIGLASLIIILNQSFRLEEKMVEEGFLLIGGGPTSYAPYYGSYSGNGLWPSELIKSFTEFERTVNPHYVYDINIVQKQANPNEVQYLLKNGYWPWTTDVQTMYKNAIEQSFSVRSDLNISLREQQKIYNQTAVLELLSMNTKEGAFLLTGVNIGHTKGLPNNINNVVRCSPSGHMEKIIYTGYNSMNEGLQKKVTKVEDSELPSLVNGFQFVNSPCNPCGPLHDTANYSCPFSLNTGEGNTISPEWQKLWNIT